MRWGKSSILLSTVAGPIYILTNSVWGFPCLNTLFFVFLVIAILTGVRWYCVFDLHWAYFLVPIDHLHVIFRKMSTQILWPIFNWILLSLSWMGSLQILDIYPLLNIRFANIFSHSIGFFWYLFIILIYVYNFNLFSLVAMCRLLIAVAWLSSCRAQALGCAGFRSCGTWA